MPSLQDNHSMDKMDNTEMHTYTYVDKIQNDEKDDDDDANDGDDDDEICDDVDMRILFPSFCRPLFLPDSNRFPYILL